MRPSVHPAPISRIDKPALEVTCTSKGFSESIMSVGGGCRPRSYGKSISCVFLGSEPGNVVQTEFGSLRHFGDARFLRSSLCCGERSLIGPHEHKSPIWYATFTIMIIEMQSCASQLG